MMTATKIKLGHIPYLNCIPFFHFLEERGFSGDLISGVPAELNRMLHLGELDVSPSSSFEYARHWQDYILLPNHSISSRGKVRSVLLFSPVELTQLDGREIAITGESATSINLMRVVLREFYGHQNISDIVPNIPVEELISNGQPALLIGDRALRAVGSLPAGMECIDLGEIWFQKTGLPFVFALWMIRREAVARFPSELANLSGQLQHSLEKVLASPDTIATFCASRVGLSAQQVVEYWQGIDYRLEPDHLAGLNLFLQLCVKHQLLAQNSPLEFLSL